MNITHLAKKVALLASLSVGLLSAVLLSGCSAQAGLVVIVTPTHVATATTPATGLASPASALLAVRAPDGSAQSAQGVTPPAPTAPLTGSETPTATFGAIVGASYTPSTAIPYKSNTPLPVTAGPITTSTLTPTALGPSATAGPSATMGPALQKNLMGIQIHGYLTEDDWYGMVTRSQKLGVGWIKVQVQWSQMETSQGTYSPIYQALMLDIAHLSSNYHFKTLISVTAAPDWARGPGVHSADGPPSDPKTLANFISRMVFDIKPDFIDAIEVWNEPNLRREWSNGAPLNGQSYMPYFDAAYKAIRAQEQLTPSATGHKITIIAAAPASGAPNSADSVEDRAWVKQLYAAGLAKYGADIALGAHPYGWANPPGSSCCKTTPGVTGWDDNPDFFFKTTLDDYRKIMTSNNHSMAKLWVTEFGWASYDGLHRSDGSPAIPPSDPSWGWIKLVNQQQQADYVLGAFAMVQHPPYSDYVGPMMLWNLNFGTIPTMIDQGRQEAGFSLLDSNGGARPVFQALADAPKQ